jgi:hypothetical protein
VIGHAEGMGLWEWGPPAGMRGGRGRVGSGPPLHSMQGMMHQILDTRATEEDKMSVLGMYLCGGEGWGG